MKTQHNALGILAAAGAVLAAGLFSAAKPAAASRLTFAHSGPQAVVAQHFGDFDRDHDSDYRQDERRRAEFRQEQIRQAEFRRQQEIRREEERRREEWRRDHRDRDRYDDRRDRDDDSLQIIVR